jgi:ureidoacrylate peracid hydrolase
MDFAELFRRTEQEPMPMHTFSLPADLVERVTAHSGRPHPFDVMDPSKTALVIIDMQNYFMKPGFQGEVPKARDIVPDVNRLASAMRAAGGHVVWIKNATNDTRESWSVFHDWIMTPHRRDTRCATMDTGHEGHALWAELDAKPEDAQIVKKRFSAFIQGSSEIEAHLRARGIDTLLIAGTATNVCCESSARDAMMLNFKVVMVPDALATYTDTEHAAALNAFYAIFGDVLTVDESIAALERGKAQVAA